MRRSMLLLLLVALALGLHAPSAIAAATITVTTTQDVVAEDGQCSLREAVIAANTDAPFGGCPAGSGADVIRFDPALPSPLQIALQPSSGPDDDAGLTGDLDLAGSILIEGRPGLIVDGAGATNLLDIQPGGRTELHDIEFRNGGTPIGDAIHVRATGWLTMTAATVRDAPMTGIGVLGRLTLSNSSLVGNRYSLDVGGGQAQVKGTTVQGGVGWGVQVHNGASLVMESSRIAGAGAGLANFGGSVQLRAVMIDGTDGPGVYNQSVMTLADCVVMNNRMFGGLSNTGNAARVTVLRSRFSQNADGDTGGGLSNTGTATIEASTFDGNSARAGGAIYHNGASLKLTNVTITGNTATDNGGGIYAMRETTLNYVTLAGNSAGGMGGNLFVDEAQVALAGSLLAREGAAENCSISAGGLNLLGGNLADDTSCAPMPGAANLMLGPLAFNGGATPTRALLPGSPAIDAGASPFCPAADQRGVTRPQGSACDAGAYEAGGGGSFRVLLPLLAR